MLGHWRAKIKMQIIWGHLCVSGQESLPSQYLQATVRQQPCSNLQDLENYKMKDAMLETNPRCRRVVFC
ncbi:hypothetical protein L1987_52647 [Smallanthus sonchifolius]|uniref:Uncharacterized protein n=1 Tax=Smallanthus sonchifolius TaxID=185202 RepID=A0ACB9EUX2_9ASTR|nr:hypothetical protein L1987_52647 [Smallanthus sonchifolius]